MGSKKKSNNALSSFFTNDDGTSKISIKKRPGAKKSSAPSKKTPPKKVTGTESVEGGTRTFVAASGTEAAPTATIPKGKGSTPSKSGTKAKKKKKNGILAGLLRFVVYIVCVVGVSVFLSAVLINVANDVFAFVKNDTAITVEIPEEADTSDISKLLKDNGIIQYPSIFKLYTSFKKNGSTYYIEGYKNGSFELSPSMNYDDLIYTLSKNSATREIVRLTFPEGSTIDEIIDILIKGGVQNTREQYAEAINNYDFDYRFINELDTENFKEGRKYRLEGYLFPDTYDFYTDASAVAVIDKFLVNFNNKFDSSFYDAAKSHNMTVDEIITIASLIEKESRRAEDSGFISSVFHNRLKNPANYPLLQSDATVQYAFEERKTKLTPEDLKYDTPYNTYLYNGLPPSAIANPGLDAITNALYPEDSSYYFFVADSRGETHFAKTLESHNQNIAMIQKNSAQ